MIKIQIPEITGHLWEETCELGSGYSLSLSFFFFCLFVFFLGPHRWHMEVPRLGVQLELQLPAYATAMTNLSCVFDLHHSSQQHHQILNPLSKARDQTCIVMDASWVR